MQQAVARRHRARIMAWRDLASSDRLLFAAMGAIALAYSLVGLSGLGGQPHVDDEAQLADTAFQFANHGQIASPLLDAVMPGAGDHIYWLPPLYALVSGVVSIGHRNIGVLG